MRAFRVPARVAEHRFCDIIFLEVYADANPIREMPHFDDRSAPCPRALPFRSSVTAAHAQTEPPPAGEWKHGLSLFDSVKYPADFKHFDYVNPNAPKGGLVRLSASGGYDSFNIAIPRGVVAAGMTQIYETLMVASSDEVSTEYGLLAEAVKYPADYLLGDLPPAPRGALAGRQAGDRRRRRLVVRRAEEQFADSTPSTIATSPEPRRPASAR